MAVLRSYPVNLLPDPELPRGLFDPRWQEPRIAAKVSLEHYKRARFRSLPENAGALVPDGDLPRHPRTKSETREIRFLGAVRTPQLGTSWKGAAINEIHRRYSFGGGQPQVNFHAQVVCFGVDEEGRWLVRATVGRWDGRWGNEAALTVRFFAGDEALGGATWRRDMDPAEDVEVELFGADPRIRAKFEAIDRAEVTFYAHHRGESHGGDDRGQDTDDAGDTRGALDDALDVFGSKE